MAGLALLLPAAPTLLLALPNPKAYMLLLLFNTSVEPLIESGHSYSEKTRVSNVRDPSTVGVTFTVATRPDAARPFGQPLQVHDSRIEYGRLFGRRQRGHAAFQHQRTVFVQHIDQRRLRFGQSEGATEQLALLQNVHGDFARIWATIAQPNEAQGLHELNGGDERLLDRTAAGRCVCSHAGTRRRGRRVVQHCALGVA